MTAAVTPGREELLALADRVRYLHGRGILGVTKIEGEQIEQVIRLAAKPADERQAVEPEELESLISDRSANRATDLILANYVLTRRSTLGAPKP